MPWHEDDLLKSKGIAPEWQKQEIYATLEVEWMNQNSLVLIFLISNSAGLLDFFKIQPGYGSGTTIMPA